MLEMIQSAYNGLKTAADIVQGVYALKSEADRNRAVIDIQRHVLDAQRALMEADMLHTADLKRIAELEQQIAAAEDWKAEKKRYQLTAIDRGAFAIMHKPEMEDGEPTMWLCQTCFEKRHKSPLQFRAQDVGASRSQPRGDHSRWGCNFCKSEVVVHYTRKPSVPWITEQQTTETANTDHQKATDTPASKSVWTPMRRS